MISNESCSAVFSIVDRAAKTNTVVGALDNSVLGACVVASTNYTVDNFQAECGFTEAWRESLDMSPVLGVSGPITVNDEDGEGSVIIPTSLHSKTMEEASDVISQAAKNAMNHAQNVATPIIGSYIDSINDSLKASDEYIEKYEIIDVTPSDAWGSPVILSALDHYASFASPKTVRRADIPSLKLPEDFHPVIKTGSVSIDAIISQLLEKCNTSLVGVICDIFNGNADAGVYPSQYWKGRDEELLKFMVAQWLIDNPIEKCGMDSRQWSTITNQLSTAYGSMSSIILRMMERDIKNNKLFYFHDIGTDKVYVNGTVYDQWLNSGGSPELIFGCLLQGDYASLECQKMIDNSVKILASWTTAHTAIRNANRSKREAQLRESAFNAILAEIEKLPADQYRPGAKKSGMVSSARTVINKLSNYELDHMDTCAITIICDVLFPHTPSKLILNDINCQLEKGVEYPEALLCAAANYITDWVLGSIIINKI